MKLSQFRFKLPDDRLALDPPHKEFKNEDGTVEKVYRRDECRLMVLHRKSQTIDMFAKDGEGNVTDQPLLFRDIINYFDEDDVLVPRSFLPVSLVLRRRPMPRSRCSCCVSLIRNSDCGMSWSNQPARYA